MTTVEEGHIAGPVTDVEPEPDEPSRRRRRLVWPAVLGAVLIAAGAGAWVWVSNASSGEPLAAAGPVATVTVERGTISATESFDGTLGYEAPFTAASSGEGTVTWLAGQGETVSRGDALFRINERSVTLLYGMVPMFRDLAPGDAGADVEQLETNLADLGYDGFTVDEDYTESTAEVVRAWQADIGVERTGTVARGDVIFVPESGQVEALHAAVGDVVGPGTPVLDITGTDQVVSLEIDIDDRDRFGLDTEVAVLLPGGDELAGTVAATAVVAVPAESPEGGDAESVLEVEIAMSEAAPEEFVGASVEVVVAVDERADVLLVPVNALLALSEGGYGLEIVAEGGTTSIVAVETGLFAEGRVEIRSGEVAEGMVVGVAGR